MNAAHERPGVRDHPHAEGLAGDLADEPVDFRLVLVRERLVDEKVRRSERVVRRWFGRLARAARSRDREDRRALGQHARRDQWQNRELRRRRHAAGIRDARGLADRVASGLGQAVDKALARMLAVMLSILRRVVEPEVRSEIDDESRFGVEDRRHDARALAVTEREKHDVRALRGDLGSVAREHALTIEGERGMHLAPALAGMRARDGADLGDLGVRREQAQQLAAHVAGRADDGDTKGHAAPRFSTMHRCTTSTSPSAS